MGITNAGIAALRMLTKLEVLDVGYLYEITDEPFGELHSLKRLICNTNSFVGNKGMIELVKNAHNLEYMNLLNTGIDENLIISVAEAVNRRRNNVQLEIRVTCNLEREWSQDVYPLLRVVRQHGPLPGPYDEAFWLERPHLVERLARMGELPHPIVNNIADDSESDNSDMEMNEDGADEEEEELEEEEEPEEYDYVQIYDDLD
uniref:Uncharacterized protein n=1 Tax=Bracon brevicornis TaxID=1563983 RepID=A0A6V7M0J2_9HYME